MLIYFTYFDEREIHLLCGLTGDIVFSALLSRRFRPARLRSLDLAAKAAVAEELREAGQLKIAGFAERAAAAERQAREAAARLRALESGQAALTVRAKFLSSNHTRPAWGHPSPFGLLRGRERVIIVEIFGLCLLFWPLRVRQFLWPSNTYLRDFSFGSCHVSDARFSCAASCNGCSRRRRRRRQGAAPRNTPSCCQRSTCRCPYGK